MRHAPHTIIIITAIAVLGILTPLVSAADTKDELKARFKQRDPELVRLKGEGVIGETIQGFVDFVKKEGAKGEPSIDAAARKLMGEENADRHKLYKILAGERTEQKLTEAEVGAHNGMRNFATAKPDEYLKVSVGPWVRRGDVAPLKREGKIGETWEGWVEAVNNSDQMDSRIAAVVIAENSARKYGYERSSRDHETSIAREGQKAGAENLANAKAGEFIREKSGTWTKKK